MEQDPSTGPSPEPYQFSPYHPILSKIRIKSLDSISVFWWTRVDAPLNPAMAVVIYIITRVPLVPCQHYSSLYDQFS
jgi:hypothetical protein